MPQPDGIPDELLGRFFTRADTAGALVKLEALESLLRGCAVAIALLREAAPAEAERLAHTLTVVEQNMTMLRPTDLYELAKRAPGLALPYDVWTSMLESGITALEERDRARDAACCLEQEFAELHAAATEALADAERGGGLAAVDRLRAAVQS